MKKCEKVGGGHTSTYSKLLSLENCEWSVSRTGSFAIEEISPWSDSDRASSLLCGNKMPTRCNRLYLLQILFHAQHVSGNTMPIIRSSRVLYRWLLPVVFGAAKREKVICRLGRMPKTQILPNLQIIFSLFAAPNTTGSDHLYNTLELLMMCIVLPETCWACNKICNKYNLLHLVGIFFPHKYPLIYTGHVTGWPSRAGLDTMGKRKTFASPRIGKQVPRSSVP